MTRLQKHYLYLLWRNKGFSLLGIMMAVITAYAGIALVATAGWFISAAALAGLTAVTAMAFNYLTPGAIVRGFSMARTAGRYAERLTSHEATFRLISRLRSDIFRFLSSRFWVEQPFDRHRTGSRLLQDVQHVESIYLSAISPGVVVVSVSAGYLGVLGYFLPEALMIALPVVGSVVVIMPLLYSRLVIQPQDELHTLRSTQWQTASSLISNFRTLVLHDRMAKATDDLTTQASRADGLEVKAVNRQQWIAFLTQVQLVILIVAVFYLALNAASLQTLEPANAFMLLLLSLGSAEILVTACPVVASLQLGIRALNRLNHVAESEAEETSESRELITSKATQSTLQLSDICYQYPGQPDPVFAHLNKQFKGAGWYWITGPSGSGKSTLMALLAGQLSAQLGHIQVVSADKQFPAVMPQSIGVLRAPLRDNLCLHDDYSDEQLWQALSIVELDQWARNLPQGLDTWLGDGEWQPSGGETKRLGLARILLQDRGIILLDEPSAGMDAALAQRLFTRLAEHWQQKLVIVNTHQTFLMQPDQTEIPMSALITT
jgi:ATP-binding cassette subfamily C protein CydC